MIAKIVIDDNPPALRVVLYELNAVDIVALNRSFDHIIGVAEGECLNLG